LGFVIDLIGVVGGSVGLLLGALKLREVLQRPRLDVRWDWDWDAGALSPVGFYFLNDTSKPTHVEHFAFRYRQADGTWVFVAPPASEITKFPFTVAPQSVSERFTFEIRNSDWLRDLVFAGDANALLFVDYNGIRQEFVVPAEMALMSQDEVRYEL
jgi:hypothetical protein